MAQRVLSGMWDFMNEEFRVSQIFLMVLKEVMQTKDAFKYSKNRNNAKYLKQLFSI